MVESSDSEWDSEWEDDILGGSAVVARGSSAAKVIASSLVPDVATIAKEFTCVICQDLFKRAHTLTCSHSFCEQCISGWLVESNNCPTCRDPVSTPPVPTRVLDSAIKKLTECCPDLQALTEQIAAASRQARARDTNDDDNDDDDITNLLADFRAASVTSPPLHSCRCGGDFYCDCSVRHNDDAYNGLMGFYWGARGHCYSCGKAVIKFLYNYNTVTFFACRRSAPLGKWLSGPATLTLM